MFSTVIGLGEAIGKGYILAHRQCLSMLHRSSMGPSPEDLIWYHLCVSQLWARGQHHLVQSLLYLKKLSHQYAILSCIQALLHMLLPLQTLLFLYTCRGFLQGFNKICKIYVSFKFRDQGMFCYRPFALQPTSSANMLLIATLQQCKKLVNL